MMIKRNDNQLPAMVQNPRFDHFAQEYLEREYALGRKTLKTLGTESGHINFWTSVIGETRFINRITPKMIQGGLIRRKGTGVWHRDGGMLIGRTYGHLANEHTKRAAQKVSFG
jgi:hypothetical protein